MQLTRSTKIVLFHGTANTPPFHNHNHQSHFPLLPRKNPVTYKYSHWEVSLYVANQHQVPVFLTCYVLFMGFYIHEAVLRTLGQELYSVTDCVRDQSAAIFSSVQYTDRMCWGA